MWVFQKACLIEYHELGSLGAVGSPAAGGVHTHAAPSCSACAPDSKYGSYVGLEDKWGSCAAYTRA